MLRMGFFLKFSQRFGMKYLVEIRVQVCSAFVLIKNGTKVHFLKWMDFFWGGREINTNKKALLKKIETFNFFPTGKLWNGRYKPKCVCDTVEIIPSVLFEISLKFYFQSENCSSLGLSFNCMVAITPVYWFDCMFFFFLYCFLDSFFVWEVLCQYLHGLTQIILRFFHVRRVIHLKQVWMKVST